MGNDVCRALPCLWPTGLFYRRPVHPSLVAKFSLLRLCSPFPESKIRPLGVSSRSHTWQFQLFLTLPGPHGLILIIFLSIWLLALPYLCPHSVSPRCFLRSTPMLDALDIFIPPSNEHRRGHPTLPLTLFFFFVSSLPRCPPLVLLSSACPLVGVRPVALPPVLPGCRLRFRL